jgi:hypothetical protein
MGNFLEAARDALWRSIREYEPLKGGGEGGIEGTIFRKVYMWNEDQAEVRFDKLPPPAALMPALSIRTGASTEGWETHGNELIKQAVRIRLWTAYHNQSRAEQLWQWIWESIQQVPVKDRPYLKDVLGTRSISTTFPTIVFSKTDYSYQRLEEGVFEETDGVPCTEMEFDVIAEHRKDPRTSN